MPFTFNGFGTRYSGRSNPTVFRGTCEFCGRSAEISSYDTRLWICAVYVPIIPLGRKRVFDMCSRCRRHRVMPLEEYRRLEEEAVREGESAYRAAPSDADQALVHLDRLLAFHRNDEAMALAEELSRRFPDRPAVLLAIAPLYLERARTHACIAVPGARTARRARQNRALDIVARRGTVLHAQPALAGIITMRARAAPRRAAPLLPCTRWI
jgi:hypothetical protein